MSLRVLLILAMLQGLVAWVFLRDVGPGFPLDDTWLHLVYARSFGLGQGFAYNVGQFETGVTAPLWTILLAVPVALSDVFSVRPDDGVRLVGGLAGCALAAAGYSLAGRAGRWPAIFTALVLTFDPLLVADRFSGMEQPLFGLLSLLFVGALLDERESRSGVLAGLLVLTRPEGIALAFLGALWLLHRRRRLTRYVGPCALFILPWLAYLQVVSGRPWPSTVDGKAEAVLAPAQVWMSFRALFGDTGLGWALPLSAAVGLFSLEGGRRHAGLLTTLAALALLAGVLLTRPLPTHGDPPRIPYYWERYALLAWPLVLVVASAGLASLVRTAYAGLSCRPLYAAMLIGPLVFVLAAGWRLPGHAHDVRLRFAAECAHVEDQHVAAGRWIDSNLAPGALVATHDAGAVRFFGNRAVLDVWGNHSGALRDRLRSGGDVAAQAWLARQRPDALVCYPILFANEHSEELNALWQELPQQEWDALRAAGQDLAAFFGLTRRAATFHVDEPATVPGPLHKDLAVFVRP